MRARLSEGYKPDFDIDLRHGKRGEKLVASFLEGLVTGTVEVKSDRQAHMTGNLWIEYECQRRDGWHDSGIRTSKADYWALVLAETVIVAIPTPVLRAIVERGYQFRFSDGKFPYLSEETDGSHPTRGVKIPLPHFLTWLRMELIRADAAA